MLTMRFGDVRSVLCLGAHADDIEVGCGGTLLRMLAEHPAVSVHWVVLSALGDRADEAVAGAEMFLGDAETKNVVVISVLSMCPKPRAPTLASGTIIFATAPGQAAIF